MGRQLLFEEFGFGRFGFFSLESSMSIPETRIHTTILVTKPSSKRAFSDGVVVGRAGEGGTLLVSIETVVAQVIDRLAFEHSNLKGYYDEILSLETTTKQLRFDLAKIADKVKEKGQKLKFLEQYKHTVGTQVATLKHENKAINQSVHMQSNLLKTAFLYAAESRGLCKSSSSGDKTKMKPIFHKLISILKSLYKLFEENQWKGGIENDLSEQSVVTIHDPNYTAKYWAARGIIIGTVTETLRDNDTISKDEIESTDSTSSDS